MRIYFFPFFTGILLGASGYGAPNEKYDQLNMRRGEPGDLAGQANNCLNPDATPSGVKITSCEPKMKVDDQGECWDEDNYSAQAAGRCANFCQTSVSWEYGPEIPYENANCECSDKACSITNTQTTTVTNAYSFNTGINLKKRSEKARRSDSPKISISDLTNVFNAGATWSWSKSYSNGTNIGHVKPAIDQLKCGYWTFIPYYVNTCGTLTWAEPTPFSTSGQAGGFCGDRQTKENWCQKTPMLGNNGIPLGKTVFVATNCYTNIVLGFCWQDPAYCSNGVSSNETLAEDFRNAHYDADLSKPLLSSPRFWCEHNTPNSGYDEGETPSGCNPGMPPEVPSHPLKR